MLGATNKQALKYATINPCRALGLTDRGTIQEGNVADIIILRDNPLDDIRTLAKNVAVVCRGSLTEQQKGA